MANTLIQLRSSGVTGNVPSTLQPGELAINFVDGKLFYGNAVAGVVEFSTTNPAGLNGELQFNSFGDLGASSNVRYDSSTGILYVNSIVANTLVNSTVTDAYNKAQGAYDLANTLSGGTSTDGWARNAANSASSYANSSFVKANTAFIDATSAGSYANSSYLQANSSTILAQAAFDKANTGVSTSTDSWARDTANGAFSKANTGTTLAQAAFDTANNATDSWVRSAANSASSYANSAYVKANTSNIQANSAFDKANLSLVVAQAAYDQANIGGSSTDSWARTTSNSAYLHANSAYEFANTLALSGGSTVLINDDNSSNNVFYVNFTDKTTGVTPSLNVSSNNLTFKPDTGTLGVKELTVSSNLSIVSDTLEITGNSATVVDSFSIDLYRTAFYQFQAENGNDFHSFSYNVGQNGDTATGISFGDIYSSSSLGTISSNVSSGLVNIIFTPVNETTTISFSRNALVKTSTGIGNDLGYLGLATVTFDYGFVGGSATSLDLGMLA